MVADRWTNLDEMWVHYQDTVRRWLQVARRTDADPAEADDLTHALIAAHNEWSDELGAVVDATHHH